MISNYAELFAFAKNNGIRLIPDTGLVYLYSIIGNTVLSIGYIGLIDNKVECIIGADWELLNQKTQDAFKYIQDNLVLNTSLLGYRLIYQYFDAFQHQWSVSINSAKEFVVIADGMIFLDLEEAEQVFKEMIKEKYYNLSAIETVVLVNFTDEEFSQMVSRYGLSADLQGGSTDV